MDEDLGAPHHGPMAIATASLREPRAWPARLVRASLSIALLGVFVLAVADVSTWWRTNDAAEGAVTALAAAVEARPGAGDAGGCSVVGAPVAPMASAALCSAKAATALPWLDVRVRVEVLDGTTVACAMVHQRSATGLLGGLVDRISTARRVVAADGDLPFGGEPFGEAPFPGHDWGFCGGAGAGGS